MPEGATLKIRQNAPVDGRYPIRLILRCPGQPELEAEAKIEFSLTLQEQGGRRGPSVGVSWPTAHFESRACQSPCQ